MDNEKNPTVLDGEPKPAGYFDKEIASNKFQKYLFAIGYVPMPIAVVYVHFFVNAPETGKTEHLLSLITWSVIAIGFVIALMVMVYSRQNRSLSAVTGDRLYDFTAIANTRHIKPKIANYIAKMQAIGRTVPYNFELEAMEEEAFGDIEDAPQAGKGNAVV